MNEKDHFPGCLLAINAGVDMAAVLVALAEHTTVLGPLALGGLIGSVSLILAYCNTHPDKAFPRLDK